MKEAYIFPGQGAQFSGMGQEIFDKYEAAKQIFKNANAILGFDIQKIMFSGTAAELTQTDVTQPAIFIHSIAAFKTIESPTPAMTAGHSLGELTALVAANVLTFEDGLKLVSQRAQAMQEACTMSPSTMAAVLGLDDNIVEEVCDTVKDEVVVAANFNCPGQVVISGSIKGVEKAGELLKEAGARRVVPLQVGGAFHSPLMLPAQEKLALAIAKTSFQVPDCPIYQNVDGKPYTDPEIIKNNLIKQLTSPVRWTQSVKQMISDGGNHFIECGPGSVLQGLVKKIDATVTSEGIG